MAKRGVRARGMRFRPQVERLESRDVPAASLSLAAGVLTVTGSSGNDSIVLRESNGRVSLSGSTKSFAAGNVSWVIVKAGKGNDFVSLAGLKSTWNKPITVTSTSGNDTVKLLDGRTTQLRGANQRLSIPGSGSAGGGDSAGGGETAGDWFDQSIQDLALRQFLRAEYADSGIDRQEMIGAFEQVQSDGTVSASEFNDLTTAANSAWLFSSSYVTELTKSVVLGSAANAKFQGLALGNLSAGSSATKLDKLVDKWFLGADRPNASYPGINVTYAHAAGTLFGAGGPQYTDVRQGAVGDCYFVGALAEIAQESPSTITNMFIVNGDGTYGVQFYQNGTPRFVTVDSQLPTYSGGWLLYANMGSHASNSSNVLWVALAEKAYAQLNEAGWLRPTAWGGGVNSYEGIEGGMFSDVAQQVANRAASNLWVTGLGDATALNNAETSGKLVGFASMSDPSDSRIVGGHQYVVVGYNHGTKVVTLFNPWGVNNGSSYPGLIDLHLSQLGGNFDYWSVA